MRHRSAQWPILKCTCFLLYFHLFIYRVYTCVLYLCKRSDSNNTVNCDGAKAWKLRNQTKALIIKFELHLFCLCVCIQYTPGKSSPKHRVVKCFSTCKKNSSDPTQINASDENDYSTSVLYSTTCFSSAAVSQDVWHLTPPPWPVSLEHRASFENYNFRSQPRCKTAPLGLYLAANSTLVTRAPYFGSDASSTALPHLCLLQSTKRHPHHFWWVWRVSTNCCLDKGSFYSLQTFYMFWNECEMSYISLFFCTDEKIIVVWLNSCLRWKENWTTYQHRVKCTSCAFSGPQWT